MLLQKAAQTTAGIRASGRKAASSSSKNRYFSRLEGGLPVTNDAINSITAKSQEDYYNKVRSSEEGWASTNEGQIEFQRLLMKAEDLRKSSYRSDKL
jgi:hypothetical protein